MRILVENFLRKEYANVAMQTPSVSVGELESLQKVVVDAVEAAGRDERKAESEQVSNLRKPNPSNCDLQRREVQLKYIIDRYTDELSRWETLEKGISTDNANATGAPVLPPIPAVDAVVGVEPVKLEASIPDVMESYVLHSDDLNRILKQLEFRQEKAAQLVGVISRSINHNAFRDGPRVQYGPTTVAPSPSPIARRRESRRQR